MSGRSIVCRTLWSLPVVVALMGSPTLAGDPGSPVAQSELQRKVARFVAQLDAEKRSVRSAALESLLALGPSVLPLLPDERSLASPAAREAVGEIRARLERESALASLGPSRVTLRGRFPLREILNRLTAQTGNRFDTLEIGPALLGREINVDYEARTFWSAIDELSQRTGLVYATVQKAQSLVLVTAGEPRDRSDAAVAEIGPFRMAIVSAALRPSLSELPKLLRIRWSLYTEPRLRPLYASVMAQHFSAGSNATAFKLLTPSAKWEISMGEGSQPLRLDSDFEIPATCHPKAVTFRGSFAVEMAAGPEQFVFDDLGATRRETRKFGSVTISLESAQFPSAAKPGTAKVEVSLVYVRGGPAFESYRTWMYHNAAWLETKNGRRLAPQSTISARRQGDGSAAVEYNFADVQGSPRDYRFVYIAPTLITSVPVEFRFQNIPLTQAPVEGIKQ
jgi:hypothetical protein